MSQTIASHRTVPAAARMLGTDRSTVFRWVKSGKLPAVRVGARYRIADADIAAMITPAAENGAK